MLKSQIQTPVSQAGFSLLEMTIALSILGIIGTFSLPLVSEYRHHRAIRITREHQECVVRSLESYLVQHRLLPRPDNFPDDRLEKFPKSSSSNLKDNSENVIGIIPYHALGLPEIMAKDGYGHFMTYVVANDACEFDKKEDHSVFCWPYETKNNNLIEILDGTATKVMADPEILLKNIIAAEAFDEKNPYTYEKNYVVFALISHGPEGPDKSGSPEEKTNNQAHFNQNKITLSIRPYSVNLNKLFRHQIVWGTQREFAGFCKSQKIMFTFKKFDQTFKELKDFRETMEKSSKIFKKLEELILRATGEPLNPRESPNSIKVKDKNDKAGNDESKIDPGESTPRNQPQDQRHEQLEDLGISGCLPETEWSSQSL